MPRMLNKEQAKELVRSIETTLKALPEEVLSTTVWIGSGRTKAHKVSFGRAPAHRKEGAKLWVVVESDEWMLQYEAENGRVEV